MAHLTPSSENFDPVYQRIRDILAKARHRALQAVNADMVRAYWEIGCEIVEEEQRGQARAGYGKQLLEGLSARLTQEFGRGFDRTNLQYMRAVYMFFPIRDALRRELSWTHYRLLTRVEKPEARAFYEEECAQAGWSTRELERQINSLFYERLLRCFLLIDLKTDKITHQDIGQMLFYVGYYRTEETRADENPPIGLILCTDKNETVVRYTLGEATQQVFASRYQLYLPTEEELQAEIQRERELLEQEQRLRSEDGGQR
jgi:hypothetical protein